MPDSPAPSDFGFPASPGDKWPAIMGDPEEEGTGESGGLTILTNRSEFARSRYPTLPRWYGVGATAWWGATASLFNKTNYAANRLYAWTFPSNEGGLIYKIGVENTVAWAAGEDVRIGIYAATSVRNIYPGRLVFDTEILVGATTGVHEQIINIGLEAQRVYWAVALFDAVTVGNILIDSLASPARGNLGYVDPLGTAAQQAYGIHVDFTYGAMPSSFPTTGYSVSETSPMDAPCIYMMFGE